MTEADDLKKGLAVLEGAVDSLFEVARVLQAARFDTENVMRIRRELEMDVTACKSMIADLGQ